MASELCDEGERIENKKFSPSAWMQSARLHFLYSLLTSFDFCSFNYVEKVIFGKKNSTNSCLRVLGMTCCTL